MPFPDIFSLPFGELLFKSIPYIFGLAIFGFFLAGGILDYHWRTYGVGLIRIFQFRVIYASAGLALLAVMFLAYSSF